MQLKNGQSDGLARIVSTRINGDLQFESNSALVVARYNTITANLQCKENNPPPTGGGTAVIRKTSTPPASLARERFF